MLIKKFKYFFNLNQSDIVIFLTVSCNEIICISWMLCYEFFESFVFIYDEIDEQLMLQHNLHENFDFVQIYFRIKFKNWKFDNFRKIKNYLFDFRQFVFRRVNTRLRSKQCR